MIRIVALALFGLVAVAAAFVLGGLVGVFTNPHAFSGRDGQGAAGLAALMLLAALGVWLGAHVTAVLLARSLGKARRIDRRWAIVALAAPALALAVGYVLGIVDQMHR